MTTKKNTYTIEFYDIDTDELVYSIEYTGTFENMCDMAEQRCRYDRYWLWK